MGFVWRAESWRLVANVSGLSQRPVETRRIVVDITSWYWHCMTGLWIYILVLFSFAAAYPE